MTTLPLPASTPAATCPQHPGRSSVGACERCGRFMCADCMGLDATCHDCEARAVQALPSPRTRATLASVFLAVQAVGLFAVGVLELLGAESSEYPALLIVLGLMGILIIIGFVGTMITFLMWVHLLARHAIARGAALDATPGWAVGWFFVPFANLVKPYRIIKAAADRLLGGSSSIVGAWWFTYILYNLLANLENRIQDRVVAAIDSGLGVIAAVLCIQMMWRFQRVLDRRAEPLLERIPSP